MNKEENLQDTEKLLHRILKALGVDDENNA